MHFEFFKNIHKQLMFRMKQCEASRLQNSANHASSSVQNDRPTISAQEPDTVERKASNNVPGVAQASLQNGHCSQRIRATERSSSVKIKTQTSNTEATDTAPTRNDVDVPSTHRLGSANEMLESKRDSELTNEVTAHLTDSERKDTETQANVGETLANDNKVKASLAKELLKLSKYGWYWGPISGDEADAKLRNEPDGAFLVRDSSDDRYVLTLSFKSSGRLLHARMEHSGGLFSLCNQSESEGFTSVAALINHSMNFSQSAVFCYSRPKYPGHPSFPVRLTKPVSRFTQVRSLQYLCRFVIRQNTRLDNIHKLPLPKPIKGYIEEAHY